MSSSPPSHSPSSSSSNAPLPGFKEQWSQLNELLPPSSDDNQIISTSSPLLLEVSAMLHDRLSHFECNKWPLDRIYEFLDSFFKSHPNLHHRSPQSKQVADPTTPVKPTSALPQQALENTPRTVKATSLLAQLRRIEDWDFLISFHKMACDMYSRHKSWNPGQLSSIVDCLIKHQSRFCTVIPELKDIFNNVTPVVDQLATVYNNLTSRFPTFNSPDQALAMVIVHLAQSHVKHSQDPEVIGTSIHLENRFYRPYCGDAPNRFLTFVSHLNAVYAKLDPNEPKPYFRGTPIVQLSGTGKTHMVYEFTRDDGLPKPLDRYPCNNHFKAISELAESDLPIVLKLVEGKASKSFLTPSYKTIFDVALRQPLIDLNEQLIAVSRHLHSGQAEVPVPPVLVAFDECIEMIVTEPNAPNNQLNSLRRAWNYIGTLQDEYKTLCFWLVLMSTSSSAAYLVKHVVDQASLRRRNLAPLHTFVGVGVDVLAEEQRALSCASQASSRDHLIRYGWPLWPARERQLLGQCPFQASRQRGFLRRQHGTVLQCHGLAACPWPCSGA
ncbi:hypothetical protein NDA11_006251 [Ustilago hordei]|nr:hypothetical protein NDA11_006251 [Ustilago hordei]